MVVMSGFQTIIWLANERGYEFRGREGNRTLTAIRGVDPARTVILSVREGRPDLPIATCCERGRCWAASMRAELFSITTFRPHREQSGPYMRLHCSLVLATAIQKNPDANGWATGMAERAADELPREFEADAAGLRCGIGGAGPIQP
jgi:hypothetical protein